MSGVPSFQAMFGGNPDVTAHAPGRVNLIGEHTDYNDGFVLPIALPLGTTVEARRRDDTVVRAWSAAFPSGEPIAFSLDVEAPARDWADYVRGMARVLRGRGLARGADVRITSTLPVGSGLSSSAALLVAVGRALREAFGLAIDDFQIALLAREAETGFVGAPVGLMDQMAASLGDTRSALFIDMQRLTYERVSLPADAQLFVIDSGIRHGHAGGEYRVRREECERAAAALGVSSLRDLGPRDLPRVTELPEPLGRRARHVITENARVVDVVAALGAGDLPAVGRLLLASHASMRDDFEISVPEIDALVAAAASVAGVYGARMTGGGFGGAIVGVARQGEARQAAQATLEQLGSRRGDATVVIPA